MDNFPQDLASCGKFFLFIILYDTKFLAFIFQLLNNKKSFQKNIFLRLFSLWFYIFAATKIRRCSPQPDTNNHLNKHRMKLTKLIPLVLCAALVFSSCDDDDNVLKVPSAVENNFTQQYPDAFAVEWERDNQYAVPYMKAEFKVNGVEHDAWYTYDGTWIKTEIDYNDPLPLSVTSVLSASYPGYRIDEVKWVESLEQHYFLIELERGNNEVEVSILTDGTIIFVNDNENEVPAVVAQNFKERYPEAIIKEWEKEGSLLKAEFLLNSVESEAWFTYNGSWVKTKSPFKGNLPQEIRDFLQEHYNGYQTDDITWVETPQYNYFEIELERGNTEIKISIHKDGTLIGAQPDND